MSANIISYNRIGTDPDGTGASSNDVGVLAVGNVVSTNINNNVISGNTAVGVLLRDGGSANNVSNNRIGTDRDKQEPPYRTVSALPHRNLTTIRLLAMKSGATRSWVYGSGRILRSSRPQLRMFWRK